MGIAETVVFRHANGSWKLVQAHASIKQRPWRDMGFILISFCFRRGQLCQKASRGMGLQPKPVM